MLTKGFRKRTSLLRSTPFFVFNFNPAISFSGYGLKAISGRYRMLLNSDSPEFGGFVRIDRNIEYITEFNGKVDSPHFLRVYIPSRTALVFEKQKTRGMH